MNKPMTRKKPETEKKKKRTLIRDLILMLCLLCIDQVTKYAARMLEPDQCYVILDHVLEIRPIENTGGPLGILEGQTFLFVFVALIMIFCTESHWAQRLAVKYFQNALTFVPAVKEAKGFELADSAPKLLFHKKHSPVPAKSSALMPIS